MLNRNFLSGISELKVAGKLSSMNDMQFNAYVKALNDFIDTFPKYERTLHKSSMEKNSSAIAGTIREICDMMEHIYADGIAREYRGHISSINGMSADAIESMVENLLQRINSLSIDVQMAIHKNQESAPPRAAWSSPNQPTILAVDNALMFLHTLQKLLGDAPYNLQTTTSCSEALQLCAEIRPNIILLDVEMPEMDGYELARRIKSSGCKAPILFVTANSEREYVDRAAAVGAVGLLVKPLRIQQLLEKLKENI